MGGKIDDYILGGRHFGKGGQADVLPATHRETKENLALKRLKKVPTEDQRDRLRYEIDALSQLQHPHIMPLLDQDPDHTWFCMPVAVGTLETIGPFMDDDEIWTMLTQVAEGLSFAHSKGFSHRDVHPGNILKLREDGKARWVIADFGFVRRPDSQKSKHTATGMGFGRDGFMAKEAWENAELCDHLTDIFALGRVAQWVVTGKVPTPNIQNVTEGAFRELIEASTKLERAERIQNMEAFCDLLGKARGTGESIVRWKPNLDAMEGSLAHRQSDPTETNPYHPTFMTTLQQSDMTMLNNRDTLRVLIQNPLLRLDLHKFVADQAKKTRENLSPDVFPVKDIPNPGIAVAPRVKQYDEVMVEACDLLAFGSFGAEPRNHDLWVDFLESLGANYEDNGGFVVLLQLQRYPVLRALYTASIGAIAGGNYDLFVKLRRNTYLKRRDGKLTPLIEMLYPGMVVENAELLDPLFSGRRRYPLSDHFHQSLRTYFEEIIWSQEKYDRIFDKVEYLHALMYLDSAQRFNKDFAPLGRFVYRMQEYSSSHFNVCEAIDKDIEEQKEQWPLLQAGAFGRSLDKLKEAKMEVDRIAGQTSSSIY